MVLHLKLNFKEIKLQQTQNSIQQNITTISMTAGNTTMNLTLSAGPNKSSFKMAEYHIQRITAKATTRATELTW